MSIDLPGFSDPVLEAQSSFRSILDAMSRPGSVHLVGEGLTPPAPLCAASASVLLTLVDADTALHLGDGSAAAADWVRFHCGPRLVSHIAEAEFALALSMHRLSTLACGTDDAPEASATLILHVNGFDAGPVLTLAGPGLGEPVRLQIDGVPDDFPALWAANHAQYPRGVDLILCAGNALVALPRSLRIVGRTV